MRSTLFLLALAGTLLPIASAHTRIFAAWVNSEDQGDGQGVYIRSPPNTDPVKDLTSPDIVCNVAGTKAVPSSVPLQQATT
ncbi:hypothetical protein C7999DRAFT_35300 [Corynascus novoguineensis]|uniref:lytic cellulose monooxygenase (C4-dehydrogenating) n=1 Tax=Corynascus novoguineensis TaxID=1126955 RepID=A0AAN7HC38_9PEZI|nr:hypothetical protein C7999DRAFT_35300 [Corynascus novoguineensis]